MPQHIQYLQDRKWVNSEGIEITISQEEQFECIHKASMLKYYETGESNLTDEEKKICIETLLDRKLGESNEVIYWKNLVEPKDPIPPTAEELYKTAIAIARATIINFSMEDEDKKIYGLLALYFAQDKRFEKDGRSLKKGLCIFGNIGCGKTTALNIFRRIGFQTFPMLNCSDISREYKINGEMIIEKYINYTAICLDDLGTEDTSKHFGNETNVVREIISGRYNKENYKRFNTHISTNLTVNAMRDFYGERFIDRCREMFNQIEFDPNSKSKRQ